MRALDRKLIRDLLQMKGQSVAISLVIACGVATFVMSLSTLTSLSLSQKTYYERYRFAHVFAHLKRAPNSLAERIAEIPGVAQVQTRIVADVTLDLEGMADPAVGRLISLPAQRRPILNDLHLRRGRYVEPGHPGEVLVNEIFAEVHHFQPGDTVTAILNGRKQRLTIVGVALSPEYIIQMRAGDLLPDDKRFGVFWMSYDELAAAFDLESAFNDVTLTVMLGAAEHEILAQLDRLTAPYGGLQAYGRDNQVSNRYISDEIRQLRNMGLIIPSIFLSIAAFLLNVVLTRVISTQREQIAALKAFGYTHGEVGRHYLKLVLSITLAGVMLGTVTGVWLGQSLTQLYTQFYRFPLLLYRLDVSVVLLGLLISCAAAFLGVFWAVRRAVKLPPAEAMRPEPPALYRPTFVERAGLQRLFSHTARMILRQLERKPAKALLSCLGIGMAISILVLGNFTKDSLDYVMDFQFQRAQNQDLTLAFVEPTAARALEEIRHLPGVVRAESYRALAVRLHAGHHSRRLAILGLQPHRTLYRLLDKHETPVALPAQGLLVSAKLAEVLEVDVGDRVTVEVLEGHRPVRPALVAGLIHDFAGLSAYMDIGAANRLMQEGATVSGAFLRADSRQTESLYRRLKSTPGIASVTIQEAALQSFQQTMAENLLKLQAFNVVFASIIACGVVYNSARITLSERSRELATLRVIGFTRGEISAILLGELGVLTLVAIPLGCWMGYGLAALAALTLDTELYRIPLVINSATYAFAVTVILMASVVSGLIVRRKLDRLDLVAVLKSKE